MERWRVHKFGGSSVADAACMERVARILESDPHPRLGVVLSACRGVTDALLDLIAAAERHDSSLTVRLDELTARHRTIAEALLSQSECSEYMQRFADDCRDILGILQTVKLIRAASQAARDLIAGYGEIWSTRLFSEYLRSRGRRPGDVQWVDAREVVRVEWGPLGPAVQWEASRANA
ncbi:MAG: bifunctional aspartate kinase/homoserine dehydrogenase I, partial [Xanthomonadaceae bacterium]|nr:bifunctional aspartate kinase/homoserine dehydrogenase I [Xanthomonadaceae bacterium]